MDYNLLLWLNRDRGGYRWDLEYNKRITEKADTCKDDLEREKDSIARPSSPHLPKD